MWLGKGLSFPRYGEGRGWWSKGKCRMEWSWDMNGEGYGGFDICEEELDGWS